MKKTTIDKNMLLGGVVSEGENYQVVYMNLKKGNQTDNYSIDKNILLFNISGKITIMADDKVETLEEFELLEIPKAKEHIITCLEDSKIIVVKL